MTWLSRDWSGPGESVRSWGLSPAASSALKARPSSRQSHPVTASVPLVLTDGHNVPGLQQLTCSAESTVIYRIGLLRKQLSELREPQRQGLMWGGAWIEATEANCKVSEMDPSDPWSSWGN